MGRRRCCSGGDDGLNRGAWTEDEDKILASYVHTHGVGKWRSLPQRAGLNRCGKSCRLRWLNYLRPDIKRGNISDDEEDLIIRLHKLLGNRWSLIARRLPGRTDNEIKNYWNTTLAKKLSLRAQGKKPMSAGAGGGVPNPPDDGGEATHQARVRHAKRRRQIVPEGNRNSHGSGLVVSTPNPSDNKDNQTTSDLNFSTMQDDASFPRTSTGALVLEEDVGGHVDGAAAELESLSMLSSLIHDDYWFDEAVVEDWLRNYDQDQL